MKKLVSIIIPAHNVEKYIDKCIKSILIQTYKNIQIIIIDDDSKDKTALICDSYLNKYDNIEVIHTKNKSAGISRNIGLERANGEYIVFIDADDYIDKKMIQVLYEAIEKSNTSVVFCGYNELIDGKATKIFSKEKIYNKKDVVTNTIYVENKKKELPLYSVWAGIYKRDFIVKNKIKFLDEKKCYSEDSIFNLQIICKSNEIKIINDILYNHTLNKKKWYNKYDDRFNYIDEWRKNILKISLENKIDMKDVNCKIDKMYLDCTIIRIKQEILRKNVQFKNKINKILKILNNEYLKKILKDFNNYKNKSTSKKIILLMMKYKWVYMIYLLTIIRSKL